ncbi:hypothetical protein BDW59DRAFT_164214 [Aspergillus cavernicola]|uniref:PARP catalytic domain-containing protein n=1 Tax=Aspergillus cavernicola TaxID=176166 RepID=A0ABR4I0P9_9EURO
MPRRDFRDNLAQACRPGLFPSLTDVRYGLEDGAIYFTYNSPSNAHAIDLQATVPELSEYPRDHYYCVLTVTEDVPAAVTEILENSPSTFQGLRIQKFLNTISEKFDAAILDGDGEDGEDGEYDEEPDEIDCEDTINNTETHLNVRESIRTDLRKARDAGFRVGLLGDTTGPVIMSASRHISKLGVSDDVMEAWRVCPSDYLVLLVRYPYGYRPLPDVVCSGRSTDPKFVQFYAGVCKSYKPSLDSAQKVFASRCSDMATPKKQTEPVMSAIFIGTSLQSLLNDRFTDILKCRLDYKFTWTGAELYLNDGQGKLLDADGIKNPKYSESDTWRVRPPAFLEEDHLARTETISDMSLLLIAMQFTLRRFVKCTDFCLNCYCKIETGLEALKPFVCSKELCLYQYMALGMGPNLEWEISSQPYVVDLLISFAYARAACQQSATMKQLDISKQLDSFPTGFKLKVPHPERHKVDMQNPKSRVNIYKGHLTQTEHGPCLKSTTCPVIKEIKEGDWIIILLPHEPRQDNLMLSQNGKKNCELHARVKDTSTSPSIILSGLLPDGHPPHADLEHKGPVSFALYDTCLDSLPLEQRPNVLLDLLTTLPRVSEMKAFIDQRDGGHLESLSQWQDRIHPSALCVLQWIVGSNRSVILSDDNPRHQVAGMETYRQFRFAQGAPDKEQRFVKAVNDTASRLRLEHPTLFAWHGSPLYNWHSILREGLHYNKRLHGRSYGDGIYMATDFKTSLGYCGHPVINDRTSCQWPNSELQCISAVALNEVVNAPTEFTSMDPFYVVQHVDWVQPRYLFVQGQTSTGTPNSKRQSLTDVYSQDPKRIANGSNGSPLRIPISATNSHRIAKQASQQQGDAADDDADSVATLPEDHLLLLSSKDLVTDYEPENLDASSVQLLGAPTYATQEGINSLSRMLKEAMKTQATTPLHELGWYIHGNIIENMYQWIVELHSFNRNLKVAKDLQKAGLTSIVLEMRFPSQFPLSPPFVRVIRPRFVRFSEGGGGHITAGGAMCMELLTNSGWLPTLSIENVLVQVHLAITNESPRPAQLDMRYLGRDYRVGDAISEYKRVCITHGWTIPRDIDRMRWSSPSNSPN